MGKIKLFREFMSGSHKSQFLNLSYSDISKELMTRFESELSGGVITYDQIHAFEDHLELFPDVDINTMDDYVNLWYDYQVNFQENEDYGYPHEGSRVGKDL